MSGRTYFRQDNLGAPFDGKGFLWALATNDRHGRHAPKSEANLISSKCENGRHMPLIDLDVPHRVIPSSTPGHAHLYLDLEMPWWRFVALLLGMYVSGVIEPGFFWWSLRRGASHLRLPGVYKRSESKEMAA